MATATELSAARRRDQAESTAYLYSPRFSKVLEQSSQANGTVTGAIG